MKASHPRKHVVRFHYRELLDLQDALSVRIRSIVRRASPTDPILERLAAIRRQISEVVEDAAVIELDEMERMADFEYESLDDYFSVPKPKKRR